MVELVSEVSVELISADASDDMVAMAAWVSNDKDSAEKLEDRSRVEGLISFLYRNKHMSPFEHGRFTFKVDVPLFVAREFHRHRTASYNEVSGRYTEMKPRFYCGEVARVQQGKMGNYYFVDGSDDQTALYRKSKRKAVKKDWEIYQSRLEAGIAKEQAREELPLSLMTQFYVTMNPRNLMQFLTLRNDSHALKEIRDVAVKMEKVLEETMPFTYAAYVAGREEERFDSSALRAENKELKEKLEALTRNSERKLNSAKRDIDILKIEVESLQKAKADIEARYAEILDKYNKEFVSAKEGAKEEQERINYQRPSFDTTIDKLSNLDAVKVAEQVIKEINKINQRRPHR